VLTGPLSELSAYCSDSPACAAFVYKPEGSLFSDGDLAYYRRPEGANLSLAVMNPTGVLYVNEDPSSGGGGGLSAGAAAGIAVGSAAAAGLATYAGCMAWRRRRRRRAAAGDPPAKASLQGSSTPHWSSLQSVPKMGSMDQSAMLEGGHGATNGSASAAVAAAFVSSLGTPLPGTPPQGAGGGAAAAQQPHVAAVAGAAGPPRPSPFALMSQSPLTGSEGSAQGTSAGSGVGALEQQRVRQQTAAASAERSAVLPELVAARTAQHSGSGAASGSGGMAPAPSAPMLALDSLPPALRDWVVPREAVVYLKRADGEPLSLGEGARWAAAAARSRREMPGGRRPPPRPGPGGPRSCSCALVPALKRRLHTLAPPDPAPPTHLPYPRRTPPRLPTHQPTHTHPHPTPTPALPCSGRVYKAVWNGEVVAAKEIDLGASVEAQQAFAAVRRRRRAGGFPARACPGCGGAGWPAGGLLPAPVLRLWLCKAPLPVT
jgi:hypothetical protein